MIFSFASKEIVGYIVQLKKPAPVGLLTTDLGLTSLPKEVEGYQENSKLEIKKHSENADTSTFLIMNSI